MLVCSYSNNSYLSPNDKIMRGMCVDCALHIWAGWKDSWTETGCKKWPCGTPANGSKTVCSVDSLLDICTLLRGYI